MLWLQLLTGNKMKFLAFLLVYFSAFRNSQISEKKKGGKKVYKSYIIGFSDFFSIPLGGKV